MVHSINDRLRYQNFLRELAREGLFSSADAEVAIASITRERITFPEFTDDVAQEMRQEILRLKDSDGTTIHAQAVLPRHTALIKRSEKNSNPWTLAKGRVNGDVFCLQEDIPLGCRRYAELNLLRLATLLLLDKAN